MKMISKVIRMIKVATKEVATKILKEEIRSYEITLWDRGQQMLLLRRTLEGYERLFGPEDGPKYRKALMELYDEE